MRATKPEHRGVGQVVGVTISSILSKVAEGGEVQGEPGDSPQVQNQLLRLSSLEAGCWLAG